jgi:calcium-binding protein 1/2/4/5
MTLVARRNFRRDIVSFELLIFSSQKGFPHKPPTTHTKFIMGCGASKEENKVQEKKADHPAAEDKAAPAAAEHHEKPAEHKERAAHDAPAHNAHAHDAHASHPAHAAHHEKESKSRDERKNAWDKVKAVLPRTKSTEDKNRRIDLWKQFDQNGSGRLSLAEVDAACRNVLHLDEFTSRLSSILIRAFNQANGMGANRGSADYVEFLEFRLLLCYIYDYFELQVMFDEVDTSDDGRVSREEFEKAVPLIEKWGLKLADADATFKEVDTDGHGMILFSEFAAWASAKKLDADGDPDNEQ